MTSLAIVIHIVVLVGAKTMMFMGVMQLCVVLGKMMLQADMGCYKL